MRLFIALNLPESERRRIHEAGEPLRKGGFPIRWAEPESFHLTLKFLGEVDQDRRPVVERILDRVASETPPFPLTLGGFGAFPTIRRPRVLWVGVDPSPALRCLKQDLEWGLANHGFERETRAFHPHLTVGRTSEREGAGVFRGLDGMAAEVEYSGAVELESVDLMRSQISRKGAQYTLIHSSPLGGEGR